jgi:eukaryotic-like serine/threonine-protein kinase
MFAPGMAVTPTLRLVRQIGAGGMGAVWVADHLALRTQVVVKFMHANRLTDPEAMMRFTREATAAVSVKSPHVVQVLDHGVLPNGAPYIVMELLEGSDLAAHLARLGALPLATVSDIVTQCCKALSRAHEKGIVHRDIKPQNIFLSSDGDGLFVKVLDFGIAKSPLEKQAIHEATRTGAMMGTPYYMSPEQLIDAKNIDHRSDLWSMGVLAFECLTGFRPFEGETFGALAVKICHDPLPLPSQRNPALAPVDAWFLRACSRMVATRFSNAKELADALASIAAHKSAPIARTLPLANAPTVALSGQAAPPLPPPPPPPPQPTEPSPTVSQGLATTNIVIPTHSSRWGLIGLLAAALLLLIGGVVFVVAARDKPAPTIAASTIAASTIAPSTIAPSTSAPTVTLPPLQPLASTPVTTPHAVSGNKPPIVAPSGHNVPSASAKPASSRDAIE